MVLELWTSEISVSKRLLTQLQRRNKPETRTQLLLLLLLCAVVVAPPSQVHLAVETAERRRVCEREEDNVGCIKVVKPSVSSRVMV